MGPTSRGSMSGYGGPSQVMGAQIISRGPTSGGHWGLHHIEPRGQHQEVKGACIRSWGPYQEAGGNGGPHQVKGARTKKSRGPASGHGVASGHGDPHQVKAAHIRRSRGPTSGGQGAHIRRSRGPQREVKGARIWSSRGPGWNPPPPGASPTLVYHS